MTRPRPSGRSVRARRIGLTGGAGFVAELDGVDAVEPLVLLALTSFGSGAFLGKGGSPLVATMRTLRTLPDLEEGEEECGREEGESEGDDCGLCVM